MKNRKAPQAKPAKNGTAIQRTLKLPPIRLAIDLERWLKAEAEKEEGGVYFVVNGALRREKQRRMLDPDGSGANFLQWLQLMPRNFDPDKEVATPFTLQLPAGDWLLIAQAAARANVTLNDAIHRMIDGAICELCDHEFKFYQELRREDIDAIRNGGAK